MNPFTDATAPSMLDAVAARHGAREAMVFGDERVTFAGFAARSRRLAGGLAALGIGRGDKVAIWLPNRPAWYVAQYACARLGAVVVALNPRYRSHELSYILAQSDAAALILADHLGGVDYFETLHQVVPEVAAAVPGEVESARCPRLRHVIVDAEDPYPGCHRLADLLDAPPLVHAAVGPDDLFTLLYTSGTTSFPKGAMMSHRNCVPHGWNCGEILKMTPQDRVLHALPAAGTWGGLNIPLTTWSHGACLVLMDVFDPARALSLVERERCTVWNAVDSMAVPVLDHPALDRFDRSSLRTGAIAATGGGRHGLFEEFVERIGVPLAYQPYGMTEVNALSLLHELDEPLELRRLSGVKTAPGIEARVAHPETGAPCQAGEEGELQFRGRLVTRGYYGKPEETAKAFTEDGWFSSGDLGVRDERGYTFFKGRLREVLRISHFMVSPGEIEAFLMSHPDVQQAFVVGVPDARTNEAAVAYVIPKTGALLAEDVLQGWCRGKIASYKIPRAIRFVKDVPRTPGPHGDKVQRGRLREQAIADLGLGAPETTP
ncbi:MAG: AMP-binding protein [Candidatus Rokubacteria bacterium]|nr:AMP-binding protein [Candidatus Rokubacteria bacterium]MBI3826097.1 AMP-binding protein [Candidatus Rokubacteria bacterium]